MRNFVFLSAFISIYTFVFLAFVILVPYPTYAQVANPAEAEVYSNSETQNSSININTASKEELTKMKGVGSTIADRIIAYRQENGWFSAVDDLVRVPGISFRIVEQNRYLLVAELPNNQM